MADRTRGTTNSKRMNPCHDCTKGTVYITAQPSILPNVLMITRLNPVCPQRISNPPPPSSKSNKNTHMIYSRRLFYYNILCHSTTTTTTTINGSKHRHLHRYMRTPPQKKTDNRTNTSEISRHVHACRTCQPKHPHHNMLDMSWLRHEQQQQLLLLMRCTHDTPHKREKNIDRRACATRRNIRQLEAVQTTNIRRNVHVPHGKHVCNTGIYIFSFLIKCPPERDKKKKTVIHHKLAKKQTKTKNVHHISVCLPKPTTSPLVL